MKTAKYLSLLALSALLVGCGPTTTPSVEPTDPGTSPSTSEPAPFVGPDYISLIGSMAESNWQTDIDLNTDDNGKTWYLEEYTFAAGDEWKIRKNHEWNGDWGYSALDDESKGLFEEIGYSNIKVLTAGVYSIDFNYETSVLSVKLLEEAATPFADAAAASVEAFSNVAGGQYYTRDSWTEAPEWSYTYNFLSGVDANGPFIVSEEITSWSTIQEVFGYTAAGSLFGVSVEEDGSVSPTWTTLHEDIIYGLELNFCSYSLTFYGIQGFVNFLAEQATTDPTFTEEYDDGVYYVSTTYLYLNENYSEYNKLFKINAGIMFNENGAVETVSATFEGYEGLVEDLESGWVLADPEAEPSSTEEFAGTHIMGEKLTECPVSVDQYFFTNFDLLDGEENVVTELTLNAGQTTQLSLGNIAPETANPEFDNVTVSVVEGDEDAVYGYFASYSKSVSISGNSEGYAKLKICSASVTRYVEVTVLGARADSITAWFCTPTGPTSYDTTTENPSGSTHTIYVGSSVFVRPYINPSQADQEATLEMVGTAASVTRHDDFKMSAYADETTAWEIKGLSVGTVTFTLTCVKAPEITATYTVEIVEAPTLDSIVSQTWITGYNGTINASVKFTPTANPAVGSVEIYDRWEGTETFDYEFNAETKEFVLYKDGTCMSNENYFLMLTEAYSVYLKNSEYSDYTLTVLTDSFLMEGTWEYYNFLDRETYNINNSYITIQVRNGMLGFDFGTTDSTYMPVVSVYFETTYTVAHNSDGTHSIVFDTTLFDGTDLSNVTLTFAADYSALNVSFTSATYGAHTVAITRN